MMMMMKHAAYTDKLQKQTYHSLLFIKRIFLFKLQIVFFSLKLYTSNNYYDCVYFNFRNVLTITYQIYL